MVKVLWGKEKKNPMATCANCGDTTRLSEADLLTERGAMGYCAPCYRTWQAMPMRFKGPEPSKEKFEAEVRRFEFIARQNEKGIYFGVKRAPGVTAEPVGVTEDQVLLYRCPTCSRRDVPINPKFCGDCANAYLRRVGCA